MTALKIEDISPINAFPEIFQEIIAHYAEVKGYPVEFFLTASLCAISTAIGRTVVLNTGNFEAIGLLWAATVGKPGMTKSEAQSDAFYFIRKAQARAYDEYEAQLSEVQSEKDKAKVAHPPKYILGDVTPEALAISLGNNPRGCTIVYDELAGFVKRFDRYAMGGDEQMFLTLFNGGEIHRTRVNTSTNTYVRETFLSIVGTIQPALVESVFAGKSDSGFFDRWLISYPENIKKQYPQPTSLDPTIMGRYQFLIDNLMGIGFKDINTPYRIKYTDSSYKIVNTFQRSLIDYENETEDDRERSILAKMEIYLHRFALLLHVVEWAYAKSVPVDFEYVTDNAANGAVILAKYFLNEAYKVRVKPSSESLKGVWKVIYDQLPEPNIEFDRNHFSKICLSHKVSQRAADNFLKQNSDKGDNKLFIKVRHGVYAKAL